MLHLGATDEKHETFRFGYDYILDIVLNSKIIADATASIEKAVREIIPTADLLQACGNQMKFGLFKMLPSKLEIRLQGFEIEELGNSIYLSSSEKLNESVQIVFPILLLLLATSLLYVEKLPNVSKAENISLDIYKPGSFIIFGAKEITYEVYKVLRTLSAYPSIEVQICSSIDCLERTSEWYMLAGAVVLGCEWHHTKEKHICNLQSSLATDTNQTSNSLMWTQFLPQDVDHVTRELWFASDTFFGLPSLLQLFKHFYYSEVEQQLIVDIELKKYQQGVQEAAWITQLVAAALISFFASGPLHERKSLFKKQQFKAGVSALLYWITQFVFDFILIVIAILGLFIISIAIGLYQTAIFL
ncbi:unnamed protein product [Cylicocyclus nassatus]|uniref:Uncharacterized protein n=1 Tax=Cylicocyclus nassatus TaxID=53992 RepID=A0AA36H8D7_CYLNA|nr:unnamed protein product [Cylicocyclus nassatus]